MSTISDELKRQIWTSTSICYCKALKETYPEELKDFEEKGFWVEGCDREMREVLSYKGLDQRNPDIHRRYMAHVLQLNSIMLELIIEADRQGVIRRAPYTIDEIMYELLDRSVKMHEKQEAT
jgi:hypothetical protein